LAIYSPSRANLSQQPAHSQCIEHEWSFATVSSSNPDKSEIRLLQVISDGADAGLVRCILQCVSLDDNPTFCALSYVWGDANQTTQIEIATEAAPGSFQEQVVHVTTNLEAALRNVRAHWVAHRNDPNRNASSFRLWTDAVCINQQDTTEREQQVNFIKVIYRSADVVLAWLGQRDLTSAFDSIDSTASEIELPENTPGYHFNNLQWMKRHPTLCDHDPADNTDVHEYPPAWEALMALLSNRY
jgi:Heterokaryon incompatibility protein (HET)